MKNVIIDGVEYVPKKQIKSLLADAKVGDLCMLKNGYWTQIKNIASSGGFDYVCENGHSYTVNGFHNITSPDIAYWESIAPEGSAEWAGQMLKLGKKVIHGYNEYAHHLGQDGKVYYGNINKDCQGWPQEWVNGRTKQTGWKLYNPKPAKEPEQPFAKVKVGDYLELSNGKPVKVANVATIANQHDMVIDTLDGKFLGYYWFSGKPICRANSPITRILKPSEVRVKISLEGTVLPYDKHNGNPTFARDDLFWIVFPNGTRKRLSLSMIANPATADLVRELIAKQGEK